MAKNPVGRPTKYKEEFCDLVKVYLEENKDEYIDKVKTKDDKGHTVYEERQIVNLPTLEGFSAYLDIWENTLHDWKKKYPEFSKSLALITNEQKKRLIQKSLSWDYNSTIAKLILSTNHWISETSKSEVKLEGKIDFQNMKPEEIYEYIENKWQA